LKKINLTRGDKLIEAAIDEFTEKNFDEASLNNILKRADISKGSFYYHFKNKQELYLYIWDMVAKDKIDYLTRTMDQISDELFEKNVFEIFRLLGRFGIEFAVKYPRYYQFSKRFFKEKNEEVRRLVIERVGDEDNFSIIDKLIKKAINNKELREDFAPDFITKLFRHLAVSFNTIFFEDLEEYELDYLLEIYDKYLDFIENGLGRKK